MFDGMIQTFRFLSRRCRQYPHTSPCVDSPFFPGLNGHGDFADPQKSSMLPKAFFMFVMVSGKRHMVSLGARGSGCSYPSQTFTLLGSVSALNRMCRSRDSLCCGTAITPDKPSSMA